MKLILVVDDDAIVCQVIGRLLASHKIATVTAKTTAEALGLLTARPMDAVLLDITLGRENGWETLRRIRETSAVPVVMMSGSNMDEDSLKDARTMGAQGVLQKPFEARALMDCLAGLGGAPQG